MSGNINNFKVDFIGIGVLRCGTTWMYNCLKEHPQICMSRVKETFFFHDFMGIKKEKNLEHYRQFFSHCSPDKIIGEFTPHYFSDPQSAKLIKENFPQAKLIVSLRNPIERLYSLYFFWKARGKHDFATFEEFLEKEEFGAKKEGFYYTHLKRYLDIFPKENILVLVYEDIKKDPLDFIKNVYAFLGAKEDFVPSSLNKQINPGRNFKSWFLSKLVYKVVWKLKDKNWGQKLINFLMRSKVKVLFDKVMALGSSKKDESRGSARPPMKEETKKYLQNLYGEEIRNLQVFLNRDLSFWK